MPDEVTLDVTTIEENVTVETTAGDVVEIQVVAPTGTAATVSVGTTTTGAAGTNASVTNSGSTSAAVFNFTIPRGATGEAGPNSVTIATTSDGTANLTLNNVSTASFTAGNSSTTSGEITIFTNGPVFQWRSDTVEYGERGFTFLTTDITSEVNYTLPNASGTLAITGNTNGEPDKLTSGTISGATTFNTTSYTYGTGAAAAHRTALGLDRASGFELFGVLRNTAGTWALLNDATHQPYNIASVSQSGYNVRINYSQTATKVGTLIVVPDEAYTARGLIVGASVGTTFADINLSGLTSAGILTFNGSTWAASSAVGIASVVMTGTQIVVTHDDAGANHCNASIYPQNHNYFAILSASSGGTTSFRIIDPLTGAAMTAAELPSGLTVSFSRRGNGLALAVSGAVSSSNLWVYGIMHK